MQLKGYVRSDCTNQNRFDYRAALDFIEKIPLRECDEPRYKPIFDKYHGPKFVAALVSRLIVLDKNDAINSSYIMEKLKNWWPEDIQGMIYRYANQALGLSNQVDILEEHINDVTWDYLLDLVVDFGFVPYGFMDIKNFIYIPSKKKFTNIYNTLDLYDCKTIAQLCQPVLIDKENDLYIDADQWGIVNQYVTDIVFDPSLKQGFNPNCTIDQGEIIPAVGFNAYNIYRKPEIQEGRYNAEQPYLFVMPFINHLNKLFNNNEQDVNQFIQWCAHIIQRPYEKVRWAPVMYSIDQGVGKDTAINFVQGIIGKRNASTIKPSQVASDFNEFAQSILIRVSEVADVSEKMSKRKFQEEIKTLISGDEEFITINRKYGLKYNARNLAHVVITTNNPNDILITNEDRRYDVFRCASKAEMGLTDIREYTDYFNHLYKWYNNEGKADLYSYLLNVDLSEFNPNAPRLTVAKIELQSITNEALNWVYDVLDIIASVQGGEDNIPGSRMFRIDTFLTVSKYLLRTDLKWTGPTDPNTLSRNINSYLRKLGYMYVFNKDSKDKRWRINGIKTNIAQHMDCSFRYNRHLLLASPDVALAYARKRETRVSEFYL